jgi:hypothetical protein
LGAVAVAALAAGGCAGSAQAQVIPAATGTAAAAGGGGGAGGEAAEVAAYVKNMRTWVQCMRKQGIDLPDPDATGFVDKTLDKMDPTVQKASAACKNVWPELTPSLAKALEPPLTAAQVAANRRFAECMRENGIKQYQDPAADGHARGVADVSGPFDLPFGYMDAQQKCLEEPVQRQAFPEAFLTGDSVKG